MIAGTSLRSGGIGVGETSNRERMLLPLLPHRVEIISHHLLPLHLPFIAFTLTTVKNDKNERCSKDYAEES